MEDPLRTKVTTYSPLADKAVENLLQCRADVADIHGVLSWLSVLALISILIREWSKIKTLGFPDNLKVAIWICLLIFHINAGLGILVGYSHIIPSPSTFSLCSIQGMLFQVTVAAMGNIFLVVFVVAYQILALNKNIKKMRERAKYYHAACWIVPAITTIGALFLAGYGPADYQLECWISDEVRFARLLLGQVWAFVFTWVTLYYVIRVIIVLRRATNHPALPPDFEERRAFTNGYIIHYFLHVGYFYSYTFLNAFLAADLIIMRKSERPRAIALATSTIYPVCVMFQIKTSIIGVVVFLIYRVDWTRVYSYVHNKLHPQNPLKLQPLKKNRERDTTLLQAGARLREGQERQSGKIEIRLAPEDLLTPVKPKHTEEAMNKHTLPGNTAPESSALKYYLSLNAKTPVTPYGIEGISVLRNSYMAWESPNPRTFQRSTTLPLYLEGQDAGLAPTRSRTLHRSQSVPSPAHGGGRGGREEEYYLEDGSSDGPIYLYI